MIGRTKVFSIETQTSVLFLPGIVNLQPLLYSFLYVREHSHVVVREVTDRLELGVFEDH
jgi:hypothetical protein